ncbi:hypothetical protein RB653_003076 [Dictyostelium firmibasis]|uniref:Uncharacterized protein n=1 Tax=Dictyostelium firmibasis TaxID=79012 RepID=A0AAN7TYZ6_9MYCE
MTELLGIDSFLEELNNLENSSVNTTPINKSNNNIKNSGNNTNVESIDLPNWWVNPTGLSAQPEITPITPESSIISPNIPNNCIQLFNFSDKEEILTEIKKEYLDFSIESHKFNDDEQKRQSYLTWPRNIDTDSWDFKLLAERTLSIPCSTVELVIDKIQYSISITNYHEVFLNTEKTSSNSTSLDRPWSNSNSKDNFHRGNTSNLPFLPGGIKPTNNNSNNNNNNNSITSPIDWVQFWHSKSLLTKPPGLDNGILDFNQNINNNNNNNSNKNKVKDENDENDDVSLSYTLKDLEREIEEQRKREEVEEEEVYDDQDEQEDQSIEEEDLDELEDIEKTKEEIDDIIKSPQTSEDSKKKNINNENDKKEKKIEIEIEEETKKKEEESKKEKQWAFLEQKEITSPLSDLINNPAIEYPFDLDSFQKQAIIHMEQGESVFITAHTSAGKTVIAEYAIAMAAKNMTRAIYTSPIKALSNQKFRDFKNTFNDVGLITGDVSISPSSSCLVLTTEILRSMLYKGADLIRDIEWVIFDEVHYLNDLDRGVVWEEVIIMLPPYVKMVFLSATVSNPLEFAQWIGRTKQLPIYVIGTTKRPIPLEHYIHTPSNELFKIVDSSRNFIPSAYSSAYNSLYKSDNNRGGGRGGNQQQQRGGGGGGSSGSGNNISGWSKLINSLKEKQQLPVIIFSFSKNKCQEYAGSLGQSVNLTQGNEKSQIKVFIEQSLGRLCEDDKSLPQILQMKELLERGIGVHHGGLLPIVKELVEILFSKSLVKVLFATETFAMGVNMPAKTVVYSSTRKHDGVTFRDLIPGEYTQMSGRAGRRGLDKVGTVIITYWKDIPEQATIESMILGTPSRLNSQFRLTYNMILNLLRVPDFKVEDMIKRSFSEFSSQKELPGIEKQIEKLQQQQKQLAQVDCILGEPDIDHYFKLFSQAKKYNQHIQNTILNLPNDSHLSVGRVIVLSTGGSNIDDDDDDDNNGVKDEETHDIEKYTIGLILECKSTLIKQYTNTKVERFFKIFSLKLKIENDIVLCIGNEIITTSSISNVIKKVCNEKLPLKQSDLKYLLSVNNNNNNNNNSTKGGSSESEILINSLEQQLLRLIEEYPLPLGPKSIDPIKQLKLKDVDFVSAYDHLQSIEKLIPESKCHKCPRLHDHYEQTEKRYQLQYAIRDAKYTASDENLKLMPQFNIRLDILHELGYIDDDNSVTLKGRVSREINTCEDLVITELIFENAFINLEPSEVVAVLSCLIFQEKDAVQPSLTPRLIEAKRNLIITAEKTYKVESEKGLDVSPDEKLETTLRFGLMQVVYEWARGTPFNDICTLTNVLEGSIVRAITRIGETCQEVRNAARVIGDTKLLQKMEEAMRLIKRDIVFTSSLYVN